MTDLPRLKDMGECSCCAHICPSLCYSKENLQHIARKWLEVLARQLESLVEQLSQRLASTDINEVDLGIGCIQSEINHKAGQRDFIKDFFGLDDGSVVQSGSMSGSKPEDSGSNPDAPIKEALRVLFS